MEPMHNKHHKGILWESDKETSCIPCYFPLELLWFKCKQKISSVMCELTSVFQINQLVRGWNWADWDMQIMLNKWWATKS